MDALDTLTLKAFILTLHQLPTISPELQTALKSLPLDPKEMLAGIEDLIDEEPLAKTYIKYQALLQSREGVRSKSDQMFLPDDDEPTDELGNTLVAIETQTSETLLENLPKIVQSSDPKWEIIDWLVA